MKVKPVESSSTDTVIAETNEDDVTNDVVDDNKVEAEASIEEKQTDVEAVTVSTEDVHNAVDTSGNAVADHLNEAHTISTSEANAISTEPVM